MNYDFEWDPAKAAVNRSKHGVSFESAASVFRDARQISVPDEKHGDDEDRWITIGMDSARTLLVVIHTFRISSSDEVRIRIISVRKAARPESRSYTDYR